DGVAEAWKRLASYAMRIERYDQAAGAYARIAALEPQNVDAHLGAALALLKWRKLDEARDRAELAAQLAGESNAAARGSAHELLARIALARHDPDAAREEAMLAREANPARPLPAFVEGYLLYEKGQYTDALDELD